MNHEEALTIIANSMYKPEVRLKLSLLVDTLRIFATDNDLKEVTLCIPDNCEKHGFVEGYHNVKKLLQFLADMLEE
ncbi:hypothetical protein [Runella sp.]|jgi:hypothetical protein|uniref:hypothetical protein n=1 Tax=Runella sp. TaxID=1960881 RepID=UPI002613C080|nr:hypothetical protein [Runella sp.]